MQGFRLRDKITNYGDQRSKVQPRCLIKVVLPDELDFVAVFAVQAHLLQRRLVQMGAPLAADEEGAMLWMVWGYPWK